MVNPVENYFSAFMSMVKRLLPRQRPAILRVPPHLTIKQHREGYLKMAADLLVNEAITPYICYNCSSSCESHPNERYVYWGIKLNIKYRVCAFFMCCHFDLTFLSR
ncbi:hypothetical protein PHMEG_00021076 [Phytophthora megakarya]|uniref:Uncharacterized protein n=1 Tax=Phytophthora megakarya TaxID=4795 RepID=A0A225VMT8_9STRA|nr:hypothetical protein PHMEG_00021076 [Phytophthora megakarya]